MAVQIKSWPQFSKNLREKNRKLLCNLSRVENSILITGCQRSGTTILTHVLLQAHDIVDYRAKIDSELLGALLLSNHVPLPKEGRYCFQTTYVNENYHEYYEHLGRYKMIYVIRNPYSVVYSMCYHWKRKSQLTNFALQELFDACGKAFLTEWEKKRYRLLGVFGIDKVRKACLAYVGKVSQLFELSEKIGNDVMVLDYDDLIQKKEVYLPLICSFAEVPYDESFLALMHKKSLKRANKLSAREKKSISETCWQTYERARALAIQPS